MELLQSRRFPEFARLSLNFLTPTSWSHKQSYQLNAHTCPWLRQRASAVLVSKRLTDTGSVN